MRVIVMGCGRVGSELSINLLEGGHDVVVIDKKPAAFVKYPPGDARTVVGLGFAILPMPSLGGMVKGGSFVAGDQRACS